VWKKLNHSDDTNKFNIGSQLESHQASTMKQLLTEFSDVFTDKLGRTDFTEHKIKIQDPKTCDSTPYKVPQALQPQVQQEIECPLAKGIFVQSDSICQTFGK
jgi:hypothetical protein